MSTAPAFDLALSDMLSAYEKQDESRKIQTSAKLVREATDRKLRAKSTDKVVEQAPVLASNGTEPMVVTAPTILKSNVGTLSAADFTQAIRDAGYRQDANGKRHFVKDEERQDKIRAIDGYVGYNPKGDFGSQELAARSQAARELRGTPLASGPERHEIRRAQASVTGFVAGIPNGTDRTIADWQARERLAVETLIEQEKLAKNAPTEQERAKAAAFAQLERDRLAAIRADLKTLGK